jgi:hypothetical protein
MVNIVTGNPILHWPIPPRNNVSLLTLRFGGSRFRGGERTL